MNKNKRGFGSDNHAPVHPQILQSLSLVNEGHFPSYGSDPWTEEVRDLFKSLFGSSTESAFVFNGTAANVLSLKAVLQSYQACLVSDVSHLYWDECGAPEFIAGNKLLSVRSLNGKIIPEALDEVWVRRGDQHFAQPQMLSITQPTEVGTVYSMAELKTLIQWAKARDLKVHMDGARLANAAVYLQKNFQEFTTDLGVDILSFGGSKNGFLLGEAVLFLNSTLYPDFKYIRKQCLQLPSKSRYLAAQFKAYFQDSLWKDIASHIHQMALLLQKEILQIPELQIMHPVESNTVFVKIPQPWVKILREKYFFYVWNEKDFTCRLIMSWDTQPEDIHGFISEVQKLRKS